MIAAFETALQQLPGKSSMPLEDQLATACLMTALGVQQAIGHCSPEPDEIIASGGGVENRRLIDEILKTKLAYWRADEVGVPAAAKEAVAFALLGAATLDGVPSNVPSATGARRAVVLGSITPKP
jgi:anhydro-N-acetylmuramic acid kinase